MNYQELQTETLARLGLATANSFFTSERIQKWIATSYLWVAGYKRWPQTEIKDQSLLTVSGQEEYNYPSSVRSDSVIALKIGSEVYEKFEFEDYLQYRTDNSDSEKEMYTDLGRKFYINPKAFSAGVSITVWGQGVPTALSSDTDTTIFDGSDEECDEAIVKYALSLAYTKAQKYAKARQEKVEAAEILENTWQKYAKSQASYRSSRSLFKRIDLLKGQPYDDLANPDRFY